MKHRKKKFLIKCYFKQSSNYRNSVHKLSKDVSRQRKVSQSLTVVSPSTAFRENGGKSSQLANQKNTTGISPIFRWRRRHRGNFIRTEIGYAFAQRRGKRVILK